MTEQNDRKDFIQTIISKNSELYLQSNGERYILVPMRMFAEIISAMYRIVGGVAAAPLYYIGKMIGLGLVEEARKRLSETKKEADINTLIRVYSEFLEDIGFGKIDIKEISNNHAVIHMYSPPSMAGLKYIENKEELANNNRVCYIEAGMIAALFTAILEGDYYAREIKHGPLNDPFCVIEVRRR